MCGWNMRQIVVIYAVMTEKALYVNPGLKSVSEGQQPRVQIVLVLGRSTPQGTCRILALAHPKFRDESLSNPTTSLLQPQKQELITTFESWYTPPSAASWTQGGKFVRVRECRK
jgi:hypothetical protein